MIWGTMIGVQVFGIYLSGSMTAYLGLLLGVIALTLFSKSILFSTAKTFGIVMGAGLLLAIFSVVFNVVLMRSRFSLETTSIAVAINRIQTITGESRLENYNQAWSQISRNPWVGVGYDQISTSGVKAASRLLVDSVHNPILQIWYTGGLFAFIGWLSIYFWVGWMALGVIRKGKHNPLSPLILSLAVTALSVLLMDQFQDGIYQREKWLVIGLLVGFSWEKIGARTVKPNHFNDQQNIKPLSGLSENI
jgi:O-antigen ligase